MHRKKTQTTTPVVFLLPLWGESYIRSFFDFGLRSLLAPGNIPALSRDYACTFLFLTKQTDIAFFKAQPTFTQLEKVCRIEFLEISDLIFGKNYSATLTLSFERGMRSRKEELCNTYFFFLVSDYIMADGSLSNIGRYMRAGYSGITTGNFLVTEEYVSPLLEAIIDKDPKGILALSAKELLALGFPFLHPVSTAHTVTQNLTHATHGNRLFWKIDEHVMIGRFYLRHMLCIKPELEDYIIGSSCDYSFIPEMCPSGNVAHIQDSDDYCVIEMAPFKYEQEMIASGGHEVNSLADRLSKWTTSVHRANAHIPVVYHSKQLEEPLHRMLKKSENYIKAVEAKLSHHSHPYREHHYWVSCLESILHHSFQRKHSSSVLSRKTLGKIMRSPTYGFPWNTSNDDRFVLQLCFRPLSDGKAKLKKIISGYSPDTKFWHLDWYDDFCMKNDVNKQISLNGTCIVIALEPIPDIISWLECTYPERCTYLFYEFLKERSVDELESIFQGKGHVMIMVANTNLSDLVSTVRQCARLLPPGCSISVYFKPRKTISQKSFQNQIAICSADLLHAGITCELFRMQCSLARRKWTKSHNRYTKRAFAPRKHLWTRIIGYIGLFALNLASLVGNSLNCLGITSNKKKTSAIIRFRSL